MNPRFHLLFAFLGLVAGVAPAQETNRSPIAIWETEALVSGSMGYRSNVLRSSIAAESSAFFTTSFDASVLRFSESGSLVLLYLFGEDTRYLDAPSVNYEQFISGTLQLVQPVGDGKEAGLEANYLYQHQIFDASADEVNRERVLVLGHGAYLRPYWKQAMGQWEAQAEAGLARQEFERTLDDYWETEAELRLTRNYGHRSEVSVGYLPLYRRYDTRQQFDADGFVLPGTELNYLQHDVEGEWRHYWDAARSWRSLTKMSFMANRDNGSGYFDYDRVYLREQLRWKNDRWEVKGSARAGWYDYRKQRIDGAHRYRSYATVDFRVERRFREDWLVFGAGEHEWNVSNNPLDEYRSWMVELGLGYEF
ncbi:hypothetical protein [Pontiella sp.]|uniref:hypothetical protein n=1 Tax=Pontiella sp. TaxID=2837462 RepID=UPI00356B28F2